MTTITPRGETPNSLKARMRAAHRRELAAIERGDRMKQKNAEQQGEIARLKAKIRKLERPTAGNLPALVRAHRAAVEDGVGNWGDTEAALFKAVK